MEDEGTAMATLGVRKQPKCLLPNTARMRLLSVRKRDCFRKYGQRRLRDGENQKLPSLFG